ncbi:MAG: hypothetical protein UV38_C0003G0218 [candidate division TM6 bacterium GW2011_GWE2_42_60]|nr:MAG: hypothetical protein UV38_C0003G0218 [candidate division TM6 bacterium GW2011_GWE2_42_60]HBY05837.1 hypothetical protein [Candidatus Dependentiae bacterium]
MRTSPLKKIYIFLYLFFPATLFCDDIFVDFARALEVAGEPISPIVIEHEATKDPVNPPFETTKQSHIVIDFGNVSKMIPKNRQNLINAIAEQKIEAPWDLQLKASDKDFKKTLGKWLQETGNKKSPQDLEHSWEKARLEKPKDAPTKDAVEKKLQETLHQIRNIVREDAFNVVPPIKNPAELKGDVALFALSFDQMAKNINTATPDDLRKIDYYIEQSKETINKAKNSKAYNDVSNATKSLLNLKKEEQESVKANYKTISDNIDQNSLEKLDTQIKESLENYIKSGISVERIKELTEALPAKFSHKKIIIQQAETEIKGNPDLLLTSTIEWPIEENEYNTLIEKLKNSKKHPFKENNFKKLTATLNSAQETLITQSGLNFTDKPTEKIKSIDNWLSKTKDGVIAWHSDTWGPMVQKLIFITNDIEKLIEAEKRVWRRKEMIPSLYCLGVPRLGLIISARTEELNTTFETSFKDVYTTLKTDLITLLTNISSEYNKKRLNALLSYEFKDDPKPKISVKPDLKTELTRFAKIDKQFTDKLQQDWNTLQKTKEAMDKWVERKGPESEKPQPVENKLKDIEKERETEWSTYYYNELKTKTNNNISEQTLVSNYSPNTDLLEEEHKTFVKNIVTIGNNLDPIIWNINEKYALTLREILKSLKDTNKVISKEAWQKQLEFLPFIFIAACLDPSLLVDEIPALLDRLFALKEDDIIDYSTKRLRYLIALDKTSKEDQKPAVLKNLDKELTYFFDLMREKKYSSQAIEDILTEPA